VVTSRFDLLSDTPQVSASQDLLPESILLFDGIFLHRPELITAWDMTIFIQVPFATVMQRAIVRDQPIFGSEEEVVRRYQQRYLPAQQMYLDVIQPQKIADLILLNEPIDQPLILKHLSKWLSRSCSS
jgi:uridine kinase